MPDNPSSPLPAFAMPTQALLDHWQGHRRVTRRVIEAFPEDRLSTFSVGGLRPFAAMAFEMISMASGGIRGIATGDWATGTELMHHSGAPVPATREDILRLWDETTSLIDSLWPRIPPERFQEVDAAFGPVPEASSRACCSTGSTTRSTIADRATSTCAHSGSSRRRSMTGADGSGVRRRRRTCLRVAGLQGQQVGFGLEAAGESRQLAGRADDAMTGRHD